MPTLVSPDKEDAGPEGCPAWSVLTGAPANTGVMNWPVIGTQVPHLGMGREEQSFRLISRGSCIRPGRSEDAQSAIGD